MAYNPYMPSNGDPEDPADLEDYFERLAAVQEAEEDLADSLEEL